MIKNFKVQEKDEETRIDRWLKRNFSSLNQNFIERNLRKGLIKINHSKVKISSIIPENLPWTGEYFKGCPVQIEAIPNDGFGFVE